MMGRQSALLEAIEKVYRARGADFFRLALARTSDPELARDAVQEGFARAIRAQRSFRGSGSLEAWIGRCVFNAAIDASHVVVGESLESQSDNEATVAVELPDDDVRGALRQLPPRQRDALFLQVYLDYDYATIGSILDHLSHGKPENAMAVDAGSSDIDRPTCRRLRSDRWYGEDGERGQHKQTFHRDPLSTLRIPRRTYASALCKE